MSKRNKIILGVALIFALVMLLLYTRKPIAAIQSDVADLPNNAPMLAFPDNGIAPLQLTMNRQGYNPADNPPINFDAPSSRDKSGGACCDKCTGNANGNPFSSGILQAYLLASMSPSAVSRQTLAVGEMPIVNSIFGGASGRAIF